ncbi:hypothetical protein IU474_06070 [Nocardia otitidiscaviarum]|uniref:hypothetical protein n=1 Tax=Nocardia otitidiscaviarum TaxID=1823 RepID=UPI001895F21C|nr:hypothetical protein [Nocardia otitidiscaviarum]MBF6236644.1 hypothetical protein [Nocardia otitidiscaviarum]
MSDPRKIDRADMVQALWPTIGPHTAESISTAAAAISELWRYLAHATRNSTGDALADPADVYGVVGSLMTGARSAAQVFAQLQEWSRGLSCEPGLTDDRDPIDDELPGDAAVAAAAWLAQARADMQSLASDLHQASLQLSHLYIDSDDAWEGQR